MCDLLRQGELVRPVVRTFPQYERFDHAAQRIRRQLVVRDDHRLGWPFIHYRAPWASAYSSLSAVAIILEPDDGRYVG
jgi:hypothetical protein